MTAQLTIEPAPRFGRVARHYRVSCDHGATNCLLFGDHAPTRESERDMLRDMFAEHQDACRCGCTAELRRRYLDEVRI